MKEEHKPKHTPGPWVTGHADGKTPMRVYSQAGTLIADCDGGSPSDVKMANARLIAASPAMYEAGNKLAAWAARAVERWESGDLAEAVRNLDYARREWIKAVREIEDYEKGVK
jgi:hypothetical protein